MPRHNRRAKLPRGPKAKITSSSTDKRSASTSSYTTLSSRRGSSPNKKKANSNVTKDKGSSNSITEPSNITAVDLSSPSGVFSSILSMLNLSFDKDIGMLKGTNVRKSPTNKQTLIDLKDRLITLNDLLTQIIKEDKESIESIRQFQTKYTSLIDRSRREETVENESIIQNRTEQQEENPELTKEVDNNIPASNKENMQVGSGISELTDVSQNKASDSVDSLSATNTLENSTIPKDNFNNRTSTSLMENNKLPSSNNLVDNGSNEVENEKKRDLIDESNNKSEESSHLEGPDVKKIKLEDYESKKQTLTTVETQLETSEISTSPITNNGTMHTTPITDTTSNNNNILLENNNLSSSSSSSHVITSTSSTATSYSIENDTRLKNPKSEFVVSQTLPKAAKDLGLYTEEGLETTGEDYLKKKYNVASYPTNDLKEYLPGVIPDKDFSCPKPSNQIQYNTFLSFVDNFLKPLTDEDMKFLENKYIIPSCLQMDKNYDPDVTPFIIPKLGPFYTKVWQKEDSKTADNATAISLIDSTSVLPKKSASSLNDNMLEREEISCGPLLSRLLSAILKDEKDSEIIKEENDETKIKPELPEDIDTPKTQNTEDLSSSTQTSPTTSIKDESYSNSLLKTSQYSSMLMKNIPLGGGTTNTLPNASDWNINSTNLDYPTFEERLKRELKYVGIYMNLPKDENNPNDEDPDWVTGREDDEISAELRELQSTLKNVTKRNQRRKNILKPLLERELAWQEYSSILDDLDKQIDQAYVKRIRAPKKKKRHHVSGSTSGSNNHLHGGSSSGSSNYNGTNLSASQLAQQKAANSSLKALLDKRQRWVSKIGPIFDKPEIMKRIPKESVFKDIDQEDDYEDGEGDVFEQNNDYKEDELTET